MSRLRSWDDVRAGWDRAVDAVVQQPPDSVTVRSAPLMSRLRAPDAAVMLAGAGGSGKSCMVKALTRHDPSGADPPRRSEEAELHRLDVTTPRGTRRIHLHVPPGQASYERDVELDRLLSDGFYPSGVVYTVAFGYDRFWEKEAIEFAAQTREAGGRIDLAALRRRKLGDENRTFARVCRLLGNAWHRSDGPVWLILAVTKTDLYWDRIGEARDHYIPGGAESSDADIAKLSHQFTDILEALTSQVGKQKLRVDVVPFSCMLENYAFGTELTARPKMDQADSRSLSRHFLSVLGERL
ncbi:hypothetical protein GCM10023194_37700 [Planotetraspora phitsanulokensis]|uniref:Uncharacterized protein n=1 Tax=Planotetraspora phitsanulokensis TaxID=575192 RepID=A0A8J3XM12_9ACTN|nr:hypothetical protein [Planotetraspora phitsanulokensis]GII41268.1 hypothetical protein Pph01_62710 [Planotetraspora phitsanulokensis]